MCVRAVGFFTIDAGKRLREVHIMESQRKVAAKSPVKVELEAGKDYWFCTCGHSSDQPFCDGSHKGTGFAPKKFTAEVSGPAFFCQCKHTENAPYCDGTHKSLS